LLAKIISERFAPRRVTSHLQHKVREKVRDKQQEEITVIHVASLYSRLEVCGARQGLIPYSYQRYRPGDGPSKGNRRKEVCHNCDSEVILYGSAAVSVQKKFLD
jgi:hypothetical protein